MAFTKVSYERYCADVGGDADLRQEWENIVLPKRATVGSSGNDIYSPCSFTLELGEEIMIPTGVRAEIPDGTFLMVVPRSGLGTKYGLRLKNTVGIVDKDYAYADNEGHIYLCLVNGYDKRLEVNVGDRIAQAIIVPYVIMDNDNADGVRTGGHGSTGN